MATWNINGVRSRLETALRWFADVRPDVACLQEIKCADDAFPTGAFEDLGYNVALHGQKSFNGVALLSRLRLDEVTRGLPGDPDDDQARFLEGVVSIQGGAVRIVSLYLPNGNPVGTDKFDYKLRWMERLEAWAVTRLGNEEAFVLAGDYNVIPEPRDARFPENWARDALFQPEARQAWSRLVNLGLTDALRATRAAGDVFTFWDYQAGAWQKNNGIRIDHMLLSPQAADRLVAASVDKRPRGWDKPSDHVPVLIELAV